MTIWRMQVYVPEWQQINGLLGPYHFPQKIQHLQNLPLISKYGWLLKHAISYTDEVA